MPNESKTTTTTITADSTMAQVLERYPSAQRALMRRYHIGGCQSCGFSADEQLADVLKRHEVSDVDEVLAHIHASHEQEERIKLTPVQLAEELKGDNSPKLIDVRTPQEQEVAKIDGALPATQELVQEMKSGWAKDTPIVTYCHQGMRSLDAASYLIGHGFTNVRSLDGGIDAWSREVDPSVPRYGITSPS